MVRSLWGVVQDTLRAGIPDASVLVKEISPTLEGTVREMQLKGQECQVHAAHARKLDIITQPSNAECQENLTRKMAPKIEPLITAEHALEYLLTIKSTLCVHLAPLSLSAITTIIHTHHQTKTLLLSALHSTVQLQLQKLPSL